MNKKNHRMNKKITGSLTGGCARLSMKSKYACNGLISPHVNFHNNRTRRANSLAVKIRRCGGGGGGGGGGRVEKES